MFGEQREILVADIELMHAAGISVTKPGFAYIVGYIEIVKLVSASSLFEQGTHPCSAHWRIRREIQYYRQPGS